MKILIAEDDLVSRRVLEVFLVKWGYEVTVAANGTQAWELLERDDAPRLAVLDWMMPGLEGIQICQKIRQRTARPYVYVLLLTARGQKQDLLKGLEVGADDYLTKPFDAEELRARLNVGQRILQLQDDLLSAQATLQFQATHDALTGLANSREIHNSLNRELARSKREGKSVGVIMMDLDHFKKVNDTFGHPAGDAVLQETGRRISSAVRAYDSVGRFGGEEFLVVVPSADAANTLGLAERIRAGIEIRPIETAEQKISITASLGVAATGGEDRLDAQALLRAADNALYRAKDQGRNRVELASPAELSGESSPAEATTRLAEQTR